MPANESHKPCPFCGYSPVLNFDGARCSVYCSNCGACTEWRYGDREAWRLWDQRAPETNTVFMVTSGSYSDYRVDGIFTTKEAATKFIADFPDSDCNGIDEMLLNPPCMSVEGLKQFHVVMLRNGELQRKCIETDVSRSDIDGIAEDGVIWRWTDEAKWKPNDVLNICVYAKDCTHAVKIANERRTQLIALGRWPEELN